MTKRPQLLSLLLPSCFILQLMRLLQLIRPPTILLYVVSEYTHNFIHCCKVGWSQHDIITHLKNSSLLLLSTITIQWADRIYITAPYIISMPCRVAVNTITNLDVVGGRIITIMIAIMIAIINQSIAIRNQYKTNQKQKATCLN